MRSISEMYSGQDDINRFRLHAHTLKMERIVTAMGVNYEQMDKYRLSGNNAVTLAGNCIYYQEQQAELDGAIETITGNKKMAADSFGRALQLKGIRTEMQAGVFHSAKTYFQELGIRTMEDACQSERNGSSVDARYEKRQAFTYFAISAGIPLRGNPYNLPKHT